MFAKFLVCLLFLCHINNVSQCLKAMNEAADSSSVRMSLLSNQEESVDYPDPTNIAKDPTYPNPTNTKEFLSNNKVIYRYACITGVIWPESKDNSEYSF